MATSLDRVAELVSEMTRDLAPPVALERGDAVAGAATDLVIPHPTGSPIRKLVVRASADGDIEVEVHVPGRRGSPFVQLFPASGDPLFLPAVARFVGDFLHGRTVLAMRRGWLRGGREFLDRAELRRRGPGPFAWVVSWPGDPPPAPQQNGAPPRRRERTGRGRPPTRVLLGAAGMLLAGLWSLALALIGLWTYLDRGYAVSRAGGRLDALWAPGYYVALGLGALVLVGAAIVTYRRHR